jgi:histidinol dehydrogenase
MRGINCWRRSVGVEKIGIYIPGGSAPLFSTVLMLAIPARIAGCKEIILCTPPSKDGSIDHTILYAANLCGITKIFKVGGAQAIAAMAYGTESIPQVFKIFGPGNQFVTAAKQFVQKEGVAIDMPAGPSEVLVIADDSAIPEFVAADLLSQAEHGEDSQVILLTTSETIAEKTLDCIKQQLKELPRKEIAEIALQNSKIIVVNTIEEAIELSNLYAPEHLILSCRNANELINKIISAGSVFIGNYSPESVGDYASGTNHTLPTNGYAAMYSGVSVDSFVKKITFQQLTKEGLTNIGNTVMQMAEAEGLDAHKNAVAIRLKGN